MIEFIVAIFFALLLIGGPIAVVIHETENAVNNTTVECIEKPDICKMRYEYMKLGDKLKNVELDEFIEKDQK
jgi:hypothetical protein